MLFSTISVVSSSCYWIYAQSRKNLTWRGLNRTPKLQYVFHVLESSPIHILFVFFLNIIISDTAVIYMHAISSKESEKFPLFFYLEGITKNSYLMLFNKKICRVHDTIINSFNCWYYPSKPQFFAVKIREFKYYYIASL